ncbi:hypothetical protein R0J87_13485 [Halomonas sp. SIMBA_159]
MKKYHVAIELETPWGWAYVTQAQAVELLGVHPKTAYRWATGQQRISPERAKLLAILSGQVVPFPRWEGFRFIIQEGPKPNKARYAAMVAPDGRRWVPDDLRRFHPVSGAF